MSRGQITMTAVITFLTAPFFAAVIFFVAAGFLVVAALAVMGFLTCFTGLDFVPMRFVFAVGAEALTFTGAFTIVAFFKAIGFEVAVLALVAGALVPTAFVGADFFETGLAFLVWRKKLSIKKSSTVNRGQQTSFAASVRALGASLTFPEGPVHVH